MCRGEWAMLCRYTICCLRNLEVSKLSKNLGTYMLCWKKYEEISGIALNKNWRV